MKVFCPLHQTSFLSPRRSPIRCENRGHVLGELPFDDKSDYLPQVKWQYCCNCEHFCPIDGRGDQLQRCPVCNRDISLLYLCDRCFTISFESNTPQQTKNFTLTSEGAPQPSCPACLQASSGGLLEHDCDELGSRIMTALNSCPICLERLDVGPVFPSSVADYLRRTKAANKVNVTFDYETGLFIAVNDGEFVLVGASFEGGTPIVLPRSARFKSKRDFYELYQDYYHCNNLNAGEVHVIEPALVERIGDTWQLQSTGILEVVDDQPKTKPPANITPNEKDIPIHEEPAAFIPPVKEELPTRPCRDCGSLVETRYAFCWKCGNPMMADSDASPRTVEMPSRRIEPKDEELTVDHEVRRIEPSIFAWGSPEPARGRSSGAVLRVIGIAAAVLLVVPLGLFVLIRSASHLSPSTDSQPATSSMQSERSIATNVAVPANTSATPTPQVSPVKRTEDDELRLFREERMSATGADRASILQSVIRTEKQYPNDYRFPYERAKLAINAAETRSHEEAFSALSLAAEKAIKNGKAQEMLEGLEAEKTTDFHKLSHGHREWTQIVEALKSKDATLLGMNSH